MIVKFKHLVFLSVFTLTLISCISSTKFNERMQEVNGEIQKLNKEIRRLDFRIYKQEKLTQTLESLKKKKKREKVVKSIINHTPHSTMKGELEKLEKSKEGKEVEISEISKGADIDQEEKILKLQHEIDKIINEEYRIIEKEYEIKKVDFVTIDRTTIPEEEKKALKELTNDLINLCNSNKTIIIYGYGCFIGSEKKTMNISSLRAQIIADWITNNTNCLNTNIRHEGLGIYIKRDEVKPYVKSERQLRKILSASRHVEIFLPKK